jgi:magnesium transporter
MSGERDRTADFTALVAAAGLAERISGLPPEDGAAALGAVGDVDAAAALSLLTPAAAVDVLWELSPERRQALMKAAPVGKGEQWLIDHSFADGTVGRLMERPLAVFRPETTVAEATETLRELVKKAFITYGFVTDADGKLLGVFAFRELLFAQPGERLGDIMLRDPFSLRPDLSLVDAAKEVIALHVPAYPVTDAEGRLIGMVRGRTLFQQQAFEISAQAGKLVGVEKEERMATPWHRSFKLRHPWLQLNLLTAFIAAAVVAVFQDTVDRLVVLAMFLPVLAGQSGNTGCQALAVTLRGMTLGEFGPGAERKLVSKEAWLGMLNGLGTGLIAGGAMVVVAYMQGMAQPWVLGAVVMMALTASCSLSGISGAIVPLVLRRLGADPATASSIFLTTATDVASMGLLLGLATLLVH